MSLTDRTASVVHRVLASRDERIGRHNEVIARAKMRQQRAKEILDASKRRAEQRRAELRALIREVEERHRERSAHLARLSRQPQPPERPQPAAEAKHRAALVQPVDTRPSTLREHMHGRTPRTKGSGAR
jgi:hypothetical protein